MQRPAVVLPLQCLSCKHDSSECRLRAVQGPCCASCRCDVPLLADDRGDLARQLAEALRRLDQADKLLLRCEPFLPRVMAALLADVRAHLGIDEQGYSVARRHG